MSDKNDKMCRLCGGPVRIARSFYARGARWRHHKCLNCGHIEISKALREASTTPYRAALSEHRKLHWKQSSLFTSE